MFCFLDATTGEALAGNLRPGKAAAKSGADQLLVVDDAIAQLPAAWCAGNHLPRPWTGAVIHPVLVRADTACAVGAVIDGLVTRNCEFSGGGRVSATLDAAIAADP